MTTTTTHLTAENLLALPPDNRRHELVKGELTTMPPTGGEHGVRTGRVTLRIGDFIDKNGLGTFFAAETGFILERNPDTVRAPDFAFVSKSRIPAGELSRGFWPGAPDLAVEVLSPSDSASEVLEKIGEWLAAGTRLVWIVDPAKKTLTVHAPNRQPKILRINDVLDGEDVLPGLNLPISEIFR